MINYLTKKAYSGKNAAILAEYESAGFLTYMQAKSIGRACTKGEGIQLMRVVTKKIKDEITGEVKFKKVPKRFWVFPIESTVEMEVA